MTSLLVFREPGRTWAALAGTPFSCEYEIQNLTVALDHRPRWTGSRFIAPITQIDKNVRAAFVSLNKERAQGHTQALTQGLLDFKPQMRLHEGQKVSVECLTEPRESKGPKLKLLDANPKGATGCTLDTSDAVKTLFKTHRKKVDKIICNAPETLRVIAAWNSGCPAQLVRNDDPLWQAFHDCIAEVRARDVALKGGAWLKFEQVSTLSAIDVNAGPLDPRQANMLAIPVLARQLTLRNIAGLIVIDALAMNNIEHRQAFDKALAAHLELPKGDISPMDKRGVVTLHRARRGFSLAELEDENFKALDFLSQALHDPGAFDSIPTDYKKRFDGPLAPAFAEAKRRTL